MNLGNEILWIYISSAIGFVLIYAFIWAFAHGVLSPLNQLFRIRYERHERRMTPEQREARRQRNLERITAAGRR